MFYRVGSGVSECIVGVLTDWDLAEEFSSDYDETHVTDADMDNLVKEMQVAEEQTGEGEGQARSNTNPHANPSQDDGQDEAVVANDGEDVDEGTRRQRAKYRTGTGPFMAIELLQQRSAPRHLYRHDLESFFWVLAWFCACFNPDTHEIGMVLSWQKDNLIDVGLAKTQFLTDVAVSDHIFSQTATAYRWFVDEGWLQYLLIEFLEAHKVSQSVCLAVASYQKALKLSEPFRTKWVAKARRDLQTARKRLDELITYESFMTYLNFDVV